MISFFITRGQYWPTGIVVACVRLSVSPSVTKFVCAITQHPFKLGSPNLDHRCKKTLVKNPIVLGGDWPWPSRSNLTSKSKFTPFWACPHNNSWPVPARTTKFGPELQNTLTHWGRVTHICVSKLTIIGSDNGLSPGRRQAIIWTNARILLIRAFGTNFIEKLDEIHSFSFSKMHLKMSSAK